MAGNRSTENPKKLIYCSGPLFCPEEIAGMELLARTLEAAGFRTFLPHRDGLEAYVMKFAGDADYGGPLLKPINQFVSRAVFALDLYQILELSDGLVFNMNGRVPDEGGVVETAVAFTAGVPLVIYKRDDRSAFAGIDNSMLIGLTPGFATVDNLNKVPEAIRTAIAKAGGKTAGSARHTRGHDLPTQVAETVGFGCRVWQILENLRRLSPGKPRTEKLVEALMALQKETGQPSSPQ